MEHREFNAIFGACGYDGPVDAADVQRDRAPVHPPVNGPSRFGHHLLRSSSTYNSSLFPQSGGFASAPFPPYGTVGSSAEHMLSSLVEAQSKVFKMVEDVSKRLGDLENVVSSLADKANESVGPSSSSSPEEKKRLPPQLSVSACMLSKTSRNWWPKFMKLFTMRNSSGQTWGNVSITIIIFCFSYIFRSKEVKCLLADEICCAKENVYSALLIDSMYCLWKVLKSK